VASVDACPESHVAAPGVVLAGYGVGFTAERRSQYYLLKVMLPLLLMVMMSWAVLWIDPSHRPAGHRSGAAC
jgi:hypothetical protein